MALTEIANIKAIKDQAVANVSKASVFDIESQKNIEKENKTVTGQSEVKASKESRETTDEKISRITELMENYVRSMQKDIKIKVDNETGDIMVKVISEDNGKVIREIPSEEMLDLAARMEELAGTIFDQKV